MTSHSTIVWCGVGLAKCPLLAYSSFLHSAPLSSPLPSVPSSLSSQSGAPAADKGPSTEVEALTAAQQGMLHAVSLHMSAPHSVVGVLNTLLALTSGFLLVLSDVVFWSCCTDVVCWLSDMDVHS